MIFALLLACHGPVVVVRGRVDLRRHGKHVYAVVCPLLNLSREALSSRLIAALLTHELC